MSSNEASSCPYSSSDRSKDSSDSRTRGSPVESGCPIDGGVLKESPREQDTRNQIPRSLTSLRWPGQVGGGLPTERQTSSIPKSSSDPTSRWEYPSPQQFYNALRRKGWETPEEEIETMVDIHNFLNEEAWVEVRKWERLHQRPPVDGRGDGGDDSDDDGRGPSLVRFKGRPGDLSPKARIMGFFGSPRPFDRHDWYIDRNGKEVRYVIDYYSAPEEVPGVPVFHLDVRPALDSVSSLVDRLRVGTGELLGRYFDGQATAEKQE